MTRDEIIKKEERGELILRIIDWTAFLAQVLAFILLWKKGYFGTWKDIITIAIYLFLFNSCTDFLDGTMTVTINTIFMVVKIKLSKLLFYPNISRVVVSVIIITIFTMVVKRLRGAVIKKFGLYWETPFGL